MIKVHTHCPYCPSVDPAVVMMEYPLNLELGKQVVASYSSLQGRKKVPVTC